LGGTLGEVGELGFDLIEVFGFHGVQCVQAENREL